MSFMGGACLVRVSAYREVGGYDPEFFIGGEEETLAFKLARARWHMRYFPDLVMHHYPSVANAPRLRAYGMRNTLWNAWIHRRFRSAVRYTGFILADTPKNQDWIKGLMLAIRGIPWVLRRRDPLPVDLDDALTVLNDDGPAAPCSPSAIPSTPSPDRPTRTGSPKPSKPTLTRGARAGSGAGCDDHPQPVGPVGQHLTGGVDQDVHSCDAGITGVGVQVRPVTGHHHHPDIPGRCLYSGTGIPHCGHVILLISFRRSPGSGSVMVWSAICNMACSTSVTVSAALPGREVFGVFADLQPAGWLVHLV